MFWDFECLHQDKIMWSNMLTTQCHLFVLNPLFHFWYLSGLVKRYGPGTVTPSAISSALWTLCLSSQGSCDGRRIIRRRSALLPGDWSVRSGTWDLGRGTIWTIFQGLASNEYIYKRMSNREDGRIVISRMFSRNAYRTLTNHWHLESLRGN